MSEGLGGARELLATFGFKVDTHALEQGENALEHFLGSVKKFAGAVAGAFVSHEIFEFAEQSVRAMASIEHSAARLGISTDQVQAYTFAAKSLGLEGETLLNMMGRLQVAQAQANKGTGEGAKTFAELGVKTKDANGQTKDADQIFRDVAEGIGKVRDPAKQAAAAQALFGRGGRQLLPILKEGGKGLDDLLETYRKLGGGYTTEAIEKAKEFEKQQARLGLVTTALRSKAMEALLPIITKVMKVFEDGVIWIKEITKNSEIMTAILTVAGGVGVWFAAQMVIAFAPLIAASVAVAALLLLVDDLIVLFKGGDSQIGAWIDAAFGKGQSTELVNELKNDWEELKGIWEASLPIIKELAREIQNIFHAINVIQHNTTGLIGRGLGHLFANVNQANADLAYSGLNPHAASTREFGPNGGTNVGFSSSGAESGGARAINANPIDASSFQSVLPKADYGNGYSSNYSNQQSSTQNNVFNINGGNPAEVRQTVEQVLQEHHASVKVNSARKAAP